MAAVEHSQGDGLLTPEQLESFSEQGFLVLRDFASPQEVAALKARGCELLAQFEPDASSSVFSTRNQTAKTDRYFLDSANNVSFFFEEKAFDGEGKLVKPKAQAINKIGHAMHDLDPVFRSFSRSPKMCRLLADLGYRRPLPMQSMYITKQPGIGGEVVPHQDSSFLHTTPLSVVGVWLALEDATKENGCLWALPGSHKAGLQRRFLRAPDGAVSFDRDTAEVPDTGFVPVEAPAGTLVVIHGEVLHMSKENTSPVSRHAYTVHLVEGAPGVTWSPENWLHRSSDFPPQPLFDRTTEAAVH
ncbi:hypothetical protein N2152v2_007663 [Parachlorella kessleri]